MQSTLKNMVLTLFLITLIAAGGLGLVYSLTKDTIDMSKMAKTNRAIAQVLPEFNNNPTQDTSTVVVDNMPIRIYIGKKDGVVNGYAIETMTKQGFSGEIKMMVGFEPNGEIYNIEVLQQNETPGLGSKIADSDNTVLVSFRGNNPENLRMAVKKDGGDIDAITASTISSRAYVDAVQRAYGVYRNIAFGDDVASQDTDTLKMVMPEYDNHPGDFPNKVAVGSDELNVYIGLKGGNIVGYASEGISHKGFHGDFKLLVGFYPDGTIYNIIPLINNENPDLGTTSPEDSNLLKKSFVGKKISDLNLALSPEGDIDGISSATYTSNAYIEAVQSAYTALMRTKGEE